MALLIDIRQPEWMSDEALRDLLRPLLPGIDIRCALEVGDPADVTMLACVRLQAGEAAAFPNLRLVQKLGAGVETIVADPGLAPHVRVARLRPDVAAQEIAEYCLAYVLREQRHMRFFEESQKTRAWSQREPRQPALTGVGVLGLGHIGARTACLFRDLGFRVLGWSRSPKEIEGIDCRHGRAALPRMLAECDHVAAVLPSTPATRDLFDARLLAAMKPGSVLINVGRGDLVVEADLLEALDKGPLAAAVLDVHREEPLPSDHPFWSHPRITLTPHVSGWHLTGALEEVAENYLRLTSGRPLLHEVDRQAGY